MDADLVTRIAGESEENRVLREQLMKQLDVLTKGSDTCKRFVGVRLFGRKNAACFVIYRCQRILQSPTINKIGQEISQIARTSKNSQARQVVSIIRRQRFL